MRGLRATAGLMMVVLASAGINSYYVYATDRHWDETFHIKASLVDISDNASGMGRVYSIDHPTLNRYIYGWVLHARGVSEINTPDVDYKETAEWNFENGRIPPWSVVEPLRWTNAALVTAAVAMLYFAALLMLENGYLAALTVAPIIASGQMGVGVVGYVGCDAVLAFFLAAGLLLMVILVRRGRARGLLGAILLGVAGGLATSAKYNGALVVIAFMVYMALANRGVDRVVRPLFLGAVSFAVFVALNPVMRGGGGLDWTLGTIWDILGRRQRIWTGQYEEFTLTRAQLVVRFFPYAAFVYAAGGGLLELRRKRWALPLVIWGAVLTLGTLFSVNRTYRRYYLPVEMGTYMAGGVFAWAIFKESGAKAGAAAWRFLKKASAPAAAVVVAAAVLVTLAVSMAPWGPSRIRWGISPVAKVKIFYRQALSYYMLLEPLTKAEIGTAANPSRRTQGDGDLRLPKPLFSALTRRVISVAVFVAGLVVVYVAGARALGSRWLGLFALAPFLWSDLARGTFWLHSSSESWLVLFTGLVLLVWLARPEGQWSWKRVVLIGALAGGAVVSGPRGILVAGAVTAFAVWKAKGWDRVRRPAVMVAVAAAVYAVLEPGLWYLGARDALDFVHEIIGGADRLWTARFVQTTDFLWPVSECFPYLWLLPLGAAALYVVRCERWAAPVAFYAGVVVAGTFLTLTESRNWVSGDVNLALSVCAGFAGLALVRRHIKVEVGWREAAEE